MTDGLSHSCKDCIWYKHCKSGDMYEDVKINYPIHKCFDIEDKCNWFDLDPNLFIPRFDKYGRLV